VIVKEDTGEFVPSERVTSIETVPTEEDKVGVAVNVDPDSITKDGRVVPPLVTALRVTV
jgi:hypothetical protein